MSNPLRAKKPKKNEVVFSAKLKLANSDGEYSGLFSTFDLRLTAEMLWLSPELAIPIAELIQLDRIVNKRAFPSRHALAIHYRNPLTKTAEAVVVCNIDFLGFYHTKKLDALEAAVSNVIADASPAREQLVIEPDDIWTRDRDLSCERCGKAPAEYVAYQYLVGVLLFSFRSPGRRRVHCRKHLIFYGIPCYIITALTGWFGPYFFLYPRAVFQSGMLLRPVLGIFAEVLAFAPTAALAVLILSWIYR